MTEEQKNEDIRVQAYEFAHRFLDVFQRDPATVEQKLYGLPAIVASIVHSYVKPEGRQNIVKLLILEIVNMVNRLTLEEAEGRLPSGDESEPDNLDAVKL